MAEKKTVTEIKTEAEVKAENVLSKSKKPILIIGGIIVSHFRIFHQKFS